MAIGIVTTWFERGAAYVSKAYMTALQDCFDVFIYARGGECYGKGDPEWDLPSVTYSPNLSTRFFPGDTSMLRLHFVRWLKKNDIHVVIFNEQHDISIVRDIRSIGVKCGAYIDYYKKATIRDFESYDFVLCNTKRHHSAFTWHARPIFIQWGTDTDLFEPSTCEVKDKGVTFFHSAGYGGVGLRKGTDLVVKAFSKVRGCARLIIHSQVPLSKFGDDIEQSVLSDSRIAFIERTVSAPGLYHLGDVYVYPSRLEGIGLSIPEALASGLPVITTNSPPMNEFITDDYNGSLVNVAVTREREDQYYWPETIVDLNCLAEKMQVYVDEPGILARQRINARASAVKTFNWRVNSQYLQQYIKPFSEVVEDLTISNGLLLKFAYQDFLRCSTKGAVIALRKMLQERLAKQ